MSAATQTRTELCEWNPAEDRAAFDDEQHGLAVYGVGSHGRNNWHLCPSCAALPRFKRFKKTVLPGAIESATTRILNPNLDA